MSLRRTPLALVLLVLAAVAGILAAGPSRDADAAATPKSRGVMCHLGTGRTALLPPAPSDDGEARTTDGALPRSGRVLSESPAPVGKIFDADDREPVVDTTAYPWSTSCRVLSYFPNGHVSQGSAVLVGPRHALTAGHVVYDRAAGGFATDVEIVPAAAGDAAPFGHFLATEVTAFTGWTRDGDLDWDVALLRLEDAPGDRAGWLGFSARSDAELVGTTVHTAGYPADLGQGRAMFAATGAVVRTTAGQVLIRDTLDAAGGQSGSGLWLREGDDRVVVGLISSETRDWNRAARITPAVFDALGDWMAARPALSVTSMSYSFPTEFQAPSGGAMKVMVANDGEASAPAVVRVRATDAQGRSFAIAETTVEIAPHDYRVLSLDAAFGAEIPGGSYVVEAVVDPDAVLPELDRTNNTRVGPTVVVLPEFVPLPSGGAGSVRLLPGGVARYRVDVPAGLRELRLEFRGSPRAVKSVTPPGGEPVALRSGARTNSFAAPAAGAWEIDLRVPTTARGAQRVRVRAVAVAR